MIHPDAILAKAQRIYPQVLNAWLDGDTAFFPYVIRADKKLNGLNLAEATSQVQQLKQGSRDVLGYGYSIEWETRKSQAFGLNAFPNRILFHNEADYLRYVGRTRDFARFTTAVELLRSAYPALANWIRGHKSQLLEVVDEIEGLLNVLRYFQQHPLPNCFARELPIAVDTKFIERHERVLRDWFDLVLPPQAIRADESSFARRYGLRSAEPHWLVRLLDPVLLDELRCPFSEFSLPLAALAALPIHAMRVVIVENKVNLLTLPALPRTIALGGMGYGIVKLRDVPWLAQMPITYWGDVDLEGYSILSSLRAIFPQTQSVFMDTATLNQWQPFLVSGSGKSISLPPRLTADEYHACQRCFDQNMRLEQERIPQQAVIDRFASLDS